jgi:carbon-monoxide dehydrogenase large subunit
MPHTTVLGKYYESGDLPALLDAALERSDRAGFEARRRLSESQGLKRGFGLGACVHGTGGVADERGAVTVHPEGYITATAGGQDTGQGHGTIYAQIAAEAFGVPYSDVRLSEGDTAEIAWGGGTGGSSSTIISGVNVSLAAKLAADKGRLLAGHVLEAATEDIELVEGRFQIRGTDRGIGLYELAAEAAAQNDLPEATNGVIEGTSLLKESVATFPQGCITCEVEIDPQTGGVRVDRVASVADVGVVVNPLLLEGQMHGAIVQGIGHALWENCWYDPETGQLIAGSWMDYVLPRAEDVPNIDHATMASPATQNPLGVKGAGELGCLGAPAAVINAVCDALGCVEDEQITLPLNAERIWRLANRE